MICSRYDRCPYEELPVAMIEDTSEILPAYVKTTSLPTSGFENISVMVQKNSSLKKLLGSQGPMVSEDKTCAYTHESTYEPSHMGHEGHSPCFFLNQDRGGFFQTSSGVKGACICDGIGGDGNFSVFFAQMVTDHIIDQFVRHKFEFTTDKTMHQQQAERLFQN